MGKSTASVESVKRTIRVRGSKNSSDSGNSNSSSVPVNVSPHIRVINGKIIAVGGYSYTRSKG